MVTYVTLVNYITFGTEEDKEMEQNALGHGTMVVYAGQDREEARKHGKEGIVGDCWDECDSVWYFIETWQDGGQIMHESFQDER